MDFLDFIPAYFFEIIGTLAGFCACIVISIQILKEYQTSVPSSLSYGYVIGWGLIFFFWGLYGIRFDAIALWLTNGIAVFLQTILYFVIVRKNKG